jgi:hypothetical protein
MRGHNRPRVEARAARARGGGSSVFKISKSGLSGGIDSVRDAGVKGGTSGVHFRMHSVRGAHGRHSGDKCAVRLIESCVRQVWRIRIQKWRR